MNGNVVCKSVLLPTAVWYDISSGETVNNGGGDAAATTESHDVMNSNVAKDTYVDTLNLWV